LNRILTIHNIPFVFTYTWIWTHCSVCCSAYAVILRFMELVRWRTAFYVTISSTSLPDQSSLPIHRPFLSMEIFELLLTWPTGRC